MPLIGRVQEYCHLSVGAVALGVANILRGLDDPRLSIYLPIARCSLVVVVAAAAAHKRHVPGTRGREPRYWLRLIDVGKGQPQRVVDSGLAGHPVIGFGQQWTKLTFRPYSMAWDCLADR